MARELSPLKKKKEILKKKGRGRGVDDEKEDCDDDKDHDDKGNSDDIFVNVFLSESVQTSGMQERDLAEF